MKIYELKSFNASQDTLRQKMLEDISDLIHKTFKAVDENFNRRKKFCGKIEQYHKSELQLAFTDKSEPSAYLIEYNLNLRKKMQKLRIGFQLEFR